MKSKKKNIQKNKEDQVLNLLAELINHIKLKYLNLKNQKKMMIF